MVLRESDLNGCCPKERVLVCVLEEGKIWRGRERKRSMGACPVELTPLFLSFPFFSFLFSFLSFFSSFCSVFSFHSENMLCFHSPSTGHGNSLFIAFAVASVLLFCSLATFVWSGCTCRPLGLCDIHPRQTEVGLFYSSVYSHDINAFSLYSQSMHPTVPPQTCLFWVVYHPSRTYLPKEAWAGAANR